MVRIKVCCIQSVQEAQLAVKHGASALGLVGRMPSGPGPISDDKIREIVASVPPVVSTFLLTCETKADAILSHHRRTWTHTIQLVDYVDPSVHETLRREAPYLKIVQVIHVEDETSVELAREVAPRVDAILLDSGSPKAKIALLGGTGKTHDWSLSRRIVDAVDKPVFLAGGLKAENVRDAIQKVGPFGLDLCSGIRTDDRLDDTKLAAFVAQIG